ncbi:MAG: FAD-dependent oxidoreductase, partial [Actinobacteria bacterium]|nr:FAD-dependent oxidoreductase [Actinomycetota bacterium]
MKRMRIQGMTCEGCNETVAEALTGAGAIRVRADFKAGEASYEPAEASASGLTKAVEAAGYRVVGIEDVPERAEGPAYRRGPEPKPEYDLLILGSGSAAFAAAIRAKDLGASVALCESNTIGGTCVNIGCVPSKALLAAGELYYRAGHSPFAGVGTSASSLDLGALVRSKDERVDRLRYEKYENLA